MRQLRIIIFYLIATSFQQVMAQPSTVLFGAGGGMDSANAVFLSYSFGEPLSLYTSSNTEWLTEGFQQPESIDLTTAIGEINRPIHFRLYPNPTVDMITVEWSDEWICKQIRIEDFSGKNIFTQSASILRKENISVRHLASGIYFIYMTNVYQQSFIQTFIKI